MKTLRVHVITEEDPFYIPVFFREFFRALPKDRVVLTGVDITPPLNQKSHIDLARKLYRFYGPLDFTRLALRYAWQKAKDRALPQGLWDGTVARLARRHGATSQVVTNVNDPGYVQRLREMNPDLVVSVAASQIFRKDLLSVPRLGCVNIHTGTLPNYRGMLPVFWQMHDAQKEIGITIHTMTEAIDLGEILLHRSVPVDPAWTLDAAIRAMKQHGARALLEVFDDYLADRVKTVPMDASKAAYRTFPGADDARAFRKLGFRLL